MLGCCGTEVPGISSPVEYTQRSFPKNSTEQAKRRFIAGMAYWAHNIYLSALMKEIDFY
jgi:hypothetical protein